MKRAMMKIGYLSFLLACVAVEPAMSQSGFQYQRTGVLNANQVRTVYGNWGVIGQPCNGGPRGAWLNDNDGYLGDVSPFVGAEVNWNGIKYHSVVTCPVSRPTVRRDEDPNTGKPWTFEPVNGYFNANQQKVATSTDRTTWPATWPDKMDDPTDPGWAGSWNGYFGKKANADQECYYVMDDNNDERFNKATNNPLGVAFKPDSTNPGRNGLGLVMRVRGMQWAQFLAKDNIFWLYEITNTGTTSYDRVVFGMLVGTYVGVTGCDDSPHEYDNDWSFYDIQTNLTYTGNYPPNQMRDPLWVGPVGMVGYAFLESPGNPYDGIDNDGDADSSSFAAGAPKFQQSDFDSTLIVPGMKLVLIREDFSRYVYTVPNTDSVRIKTRGMDSVWIYPGKTKVAEGNELIDVQGNSYVNPNAYDGVDNNFNGIIDENQYLHFHEIKVTRTVPPKVLIDVFRPLRHVDYVNNLGSSPYSMIDEKRDDLIDNNRNWNVQFDDVGRDGIPDTHDYGENDGMPTSGYDNNYHDTGEPGEPHVDKTDVNESDQIGLTSFWYFTPSGNINLADKEGLWKALAPGYFDVPASIVNNEPQNGEDGDFIYGSGYFPLLAGSTERFSLALVYGGANSSLGIDGKIADLLKNKQTVQKIYDANYQFPQPPDKPTLTAVPGDHEVTLYWDRRAESTIDPVLRVKTFEGYKIYRSTDPNFSDIFTITDARGVPQGYRPLAQFDLADSITGYFLANAEQFQDAAGYSYYLGDDSGLEHSYVDNSVENGRQYYYAVVAYSRGDENLGIFPAENTKFFSVQSTGEILTDINTAVVIPGPKVPGYVYPADAVPLTHVVRYGTGNVLYNVVDDTRVLGHTYQVTFLDELVDSTAYANGQINPADSTKWARRTTSYTVLDTTTFEETFQSNDTSLVTLRRKNIVPSTAVLRSQTGTVSPSDYVLNPTLGTVRGTSSGSLPAGTYTLSYKYYPVYRSPYIRNSPFVTQGKEKDADIFDGVELTFNNSWDVKLIDSLSGWVGKNAYVFNLFPTQLLLGQIRGYTNPNDYEIQFSNSIVDTSVADSRLFTSAIPTYFRVYNTTDSEYVKFVYYDNVGTSAAYGRLAASDEIILLEQNPTGALSYSWDITFVSKVGEPADTLYPLGDGDKLVLKTTHPFRQGDVFQFTTVAPRVDEAQAKSDLTLKRIRAVPNPYVTASTLEPPLPPGITSGRGERRIDFIHVPAGAKISIFTSRGEHVITLYQDGNIEDGTVTWNLKTKENLDIAFGVYFYVVESSVGTTTGKLAIIK